MIITGILIRYYAAYHNFDMEYSNSPFFRIDALSYGLVVAYLCRQSKITILGNQVTKNVWLICGTVCGIMAIQAWKLANDTSSQGIGVYEVLGASCLGIISSMIIVIMSTWRSKKDKYINKAIKELAKISYSVYLIHIPVRSYLISLGSPYEDNRIGMFVAYMIISIFIGNFTYQLAEKPFIKLKNKIGYG